MTPTYRILKTYFIGAVVLYHIKTRTSHCCVVNIITRCGRCNCPLMLSHGLSSCHQCQDINPSAYPIWNISCGLFRPCFRLPYGCSVYNSWLNHDHKLVPGRQYRLYLNLPRLDNTSRINRQCTCLLVHYWNCSWGFIIFATVRHGTPWDCHGTPWQLPWHIMRRHDVS